MKIVKDNLRALSIEEIKAVFPYARKMIEHELERNGFITLSDMVDLLNMFMPDGVRIANPCPDLSDKIGWAREDGEYTIL